jgi:hypothetical protein
MLTASKRVWVGRVMSGLVIGLMAFSAFMKLNPTPEMLDGMSKQGTSIELLRIIMILEFLSLLVYAIPQTTLVGAILITGYMGGAILTHLKLGDVVFIQVAVAVFAWGGIWLRDERLRTLMPLRKEL